MSELSRRSIVAGASALPALAIPAAAPIALPDPTFAVIETHRNALLSAFRAGKIICETPNDDRTKEGDLVEARAYALADEVTYKLSEVVPTTFAGVFALMEYVDGLHVGKVQLPDERNDWFSAWDDEGGWVRGQTYQGDGLVSPFNGEPFDLPLIFWVMRNVQTALRSLTGAAA